MSSQLLTPITETCSSLRRNLDQLLSLIVSCRRPLSLVRTHLTLVLFLSRKTLRRDTLMKLLLKSMELISRLLTMESTSLKLVSLSNQVYLLKRVAMERNHHSSLNQLKRFLILMKHLTCKSLLSLKKQNCTRMK